ncbi:hypothetical protein L0U88_15125 [Flavihumibacter sp. RY-1]|uniref:Lipoprotein n=1 Tax=Flavihumibacter fluminis TaxID=2909236 RepID=A0ABS9BJV1_9BACT|nr:hypothetical protein [Flavihumibacter fluminis]MCF1715971.1 hypothetical protein [Flavihumibacter fluminis]
MQIFRLLLIAFLTIFLTGCNWFRPTAYFFISNISKERKAVDIKVSIAAKKVLDDSIRYTGIQPDLSNTSNISLPKGKYVKKVTADNGQALAEQPIYLGNDKWIFISYSYLPIDTAHANMLINKLGDDTASVNLRLGGHPPSVTIFIMDKEPVHM